MAKYTLEDIMCGEKYNIESDVFMEVFRLVGQKADAKTIREQLNTIYVKHALLVAKKMHDEGDCISDDCKITRKERKSIIKHNRA